MKLLKNKKIVNIIMSNKRGKRGRPKKFSVQLTIRNEEQLQRTLNLCGIKKAHPHINNIMNAAIEQLEAEERKKSIELAKKWKHGYGWPNDMMSYECMGELYPDDEYDPYEEVYDSLGGKSSRKLKLLNKKLFKNKKKNRKGSEDVDDFWGNRFSMYRNGELDDIEDAETYEEPYKSIKFYSDINNELSVREFNSLNDFDKFCSENDYIINTVDYNNLMNWSVIHCCLDPISEEYGEHEIITDNSYGALYWTVSEDEVKYSNAK